MPQSESKGLDYYAKNWANSAINTAFFDTLGYISCSGIEWMVASGLDWGSVLGAGFLGSIVLYVPVMALLNLLISYNLLSELGKDLIYLAYRLSSAVTGAAILNMCFGMAIPLAPVFMCAAIGTAVYYLLKACGCCGAPETEVEATVEIPAVPANRQDNFQSYQSGYPRRQFNANYTNPRSSGGVVIEELGANGTPIATAFYSN